MADFKEIIKKLRQDAQLTQDQLAVALGLSRSAVSMYERGEREPDFETLEIIADYFNVDMNYLTGWSEDPVNYDDPNLIANLSTELLRHFNGDVKRAFASQRAMENDAKNERPAFRRAESLKLDGVYLSMAAKVREAGLTEKDLDIMLEMYKKAKELSGE